MIFESSAKVRDDRIIILFKSEMWPLKVLKKKIDFGVEDFLCDTIRDNYRKIIELEIYIRRNRYTALLIMSLMVNPK